MDIQHVNSLARGLKILESFSPRSFRMSLTEIYRATDTPKASAYRLLKTLTELNYLKYDARHKRYFPGPRVLALGFSVLQGIEIQEIIRPYLQVLSERCGKTVNFAVLDDTEMVYIERVRGPESRDFTLGIGSRIPLYSTSLGRAVLAHMEKRKLESILQKLDADPASGPFIADRAALFRRLQDIRSRGYETARDEYMEGLAAAAAPVFDSDGVLGGINLIVASASVKPRDVKVRYAPLLVTAAREISEALGRVPVP